MDKAKFEASQVFMYNVNRIWTILKDQEKVQQFLCANARRSDGNSNRTENQNCVNSSPRSNYETTSISLSQKEIITNSFFKQITYVLTNSAVKMEKLVKFILYPNTLDNSTLTILEISSIDEPTNKYEIDLNPVDDFYNKTFVIQLLEKFEDYLKVSPVFLYEYQSILINSPLKIVLKNLFSIRKLRNISRCAPYNFSGNSLAVNEKFSYYNFQQEKKYAKVKECEREKGKNQLTMVFELYDDNYSQVLSEVSFKILMINENCTFVTFHHDFHSSINQSELNSLASKKQELLFDLKKYCEGNSSTNIR